METRKPLHLIPEAALNVGGDHLLKFSNVELEEALIGSIIIDPSVLGELLTNPAGCPPALFTVFGTREIFKAMLRLYDAVPRRNIDLVSVSEELRKAGTLEDIGHEVYLIGLINTVPTSVNYMTYFRQLTELHQRRMAISLANLVLGEAMHGDYDMLADNILSLTTSFINPLSEEGRQMQHISAGVDEADAKVMEVLAQGDGMLGIPTGFTDLDNHLGGLPKGEMSVIIADTSIGKSQFLLQMATHAAENGVIPLIYSMEMTDWSLALRLIATRMGVSVHRLRRANLTKDEWHEYEAAKEWVKSLEFYVDDTPAMQAKELRSRAIRSYAQFDIGLVGVDYLQLLTGETSTDDWLAVTGAMREMHTLARSLDAHVVVLANTNRGVVHGADKRPQKHHGAGSGAIEKYADLLLALYRHSVYYPDSPKYKHDGEIRVLKFRQGPITDIKLGFLEGFWLDYSMVEDLVAQLAQEDAEDVPEDIVF